MRTRLFPDELALRRHQREGRRLRHKILREVMDDHKDELQLYRTAVRDVEAVYGSLEPDCGGLDLAVFNLLRWSAATYLVIDNWRGCHVWPARDLQDALSGPPQPLRLYGILCAYLRRPERLWLIEPRLRALMVWLPLFAKSVGVVQAMIVPVSQTVLQNAAKAGATTMDAVVAAQL